EELAEAGGMSRSTFFRKFGSKEDVVFADHERILSQVNALLVESTQDPLAAVEDAALLVFNHHLRNPGTSRARYQLLQAVPALRDRELVTSHRYERAFLRHVLDKLPDDGGHEHTAVAFAASVVAVHNAFLRQWLRAVAVGTAAGDAAPGDQERAASLAAELHGLSRLFRPVLLGRGRAVQPPTVVVTVLSDAPDKEAIVRAVRDALP
ncbi:MAG: TetR family transcriptional regulator, partial [Pseudarthrobacter sp.]|nr:TetR family transcriptional regulator [Pseudarthrobacter sp.]